MRYKDLETTGIFMAKHTFERKDRFYFLAKKEGYVARSAYKIIELDKRFGIFKNHSRILDLGCAPGGWLQVAEECLKGNSQLIGIDLLPLKFSPLATTLFIQGNFLDAENQQLITQTFSGEIDWVLSDMSPNISGISFRDEFQSYELVQSAFDFAKRLLKKNGNFLFKVFQGKEFETFRQTLKQSFQKIITVLPEATRKSSKEIYVVCLGYKKNSEVE